MEKVLPAVVGEFAICWKIYIIQFVGIKYTVQFHLKIFFPSKEDKNRTIIEH